MNIRLFILLLIVCYACHLPGQTKFEKQPDFTLKVKIQNLGNNYVSCGIVVFTQCFVAEVIDENEKKILGEQVHLFVTCPEILKNLLNTNDGIFTLHVALLTRADEGKLGIVRGCSRPDEKYLTKLKFEGFAEKY